MYKKYDHKIFNLPNGVSITCHTENTRYGFRHLAALSKNAWIQGRSKACYYNRSWESYTYETVANTLIRSYINEDEQEQYITAAKAIANGETEKVFGSLKALAAIGDLLCADPAQKNQIKKTILSNISGVDFPADFETLPEKEKTRRLNGAIGVLGEA